MESARQNGDDTKDSVPWGEHWDSRNGVGFLERANRLFQTRGVLEECDLVVQVKDHWYILQGRVDSHQTKSKLFGLVPSHEGSQFIVDRLRVGQNGEA